MYKLRINKKGNFGDFEMEFISDDIKELQKSLTLHRKYGFDGFIFTDGLK